MEKIKIHRASSIRGSWGDPDPLNGPDWINHDEMVRRTIERHMGEPLPREIFEREYVYNMHFKPDKRGQEGDGVPGIVSIAYKRRTKSRMLKLPKFFTP